MLFSERYSDLIDVGHGEPVDNICNDIVVTMMSLTNMDCWILSSLCLRQFGIYLTDFGIVTTDIMTSASKKQTAYRPVLEPI